MFDVTPFPFLYVAPRAHGPIAFKFTLHRMTAVAEPWLGQPRVVYDGGMLLTVKHLIVKLPRYNRMAYVKPILVEHVVS